MEMDREIICNQTRRWKPGMTNDLRDTIPLMVSEDYIDRFIAEYYQIVIRYKKLQKMLNKWDNGELNFKPECPRRIYDDQLIYMKDYILILEDRAIFEGIDIKKGVKKWGIC